MIIETEMNCSDICWAEPVRVRVGHGVPVNIDGPQSALNTMMQRWPQTGGEQYERARKTLHGGAWQTRPGGIHPRRLCRRMR